MALIQNEPYLMHDTHGDVAEPVALRPIEVIAIHSSIYNRFTKQHCIEEFMAYQKAREVCSLDDLAVNLVMSDAINAFFDNWLVSNPGYDYRYVDDAFRTRVTEAEKTEYQKVVSFHSKQSHVTDGVEAFLKPKAYEKAQGLTSHESDCVVATPHPAFVPTSKDALTYRVVTYLSSIYIVVEEGFLEQMEDNTSKLKFISDILKTAYAMMPINTVNRSQWYDIYLDALKVSTPQ